MSGVCLAMWSGPRNISTAMMRAWENRSDTRVVDEPFYAHFLSHTGIQHPMCAEIIQHGETDWQEVIDSLSEKPESGIFYQKHITTHWLPHLPTDWLRELEHVFLIREPEHVAASYSIKRQSPTASDLGYVQQSELFKVISKLIDRKPLVIDSKRFLNDPESQLNKVCNSLKIDFEEAMLSWPRGIRESDGRWASHWYDAVVESTGFRSPSLKAITLTDSQKAIAAECRPYYDDLVQHAI